MGLFGIFRGIGKIIEGVAEGSGKKIVKGALRTGIGIITLGSVDSDDDADQDDYDE